MHLLPGEHRVLVIWRYGRLGVGSSAQGKVTLRFVAEAGHTYSLAKREVQLVKGESGQTMRVFLPFIMDDLDKREVSTMEE